MCITSKASSVNAGRIERASQKVEKRSRTSRCDARQDAKLCVGNNTPRRPGRMKHVERPCGRPRNGQVSEFTKLSHFREPQKAGECSLRLWRGTVMVSSGHWRGKLARVFRCRLVWRRPENQRWDIKLLTEMNGEPGNTISRQQEKPQIKDRECIAVKHLIKCGGQRGSMTCCEHAGSNLRDLKARTQDIVDNEVVQSDSQRKFEPQRNPPNSPSKAPCKAQLVAQRWLRADPRWRTAE